VSQTGVAPEQLELLVHPPRHTKKCGSHTGCAAPQSELLTHWTHWFVAVWHLGAFGGQSLSAIHCTHCSVAELQAAIGAAQSADVWHPTHAPTPDDVSQMCATPGQSMFVMHAAWQLLSPGQHEGLAAGQSLFFAHSPHAPVPGRHTGAACGQFASEVHSTQPSTGSHWRPARHSLVPFTPQSALPGPGPLAPSVLPPQATSTKTTAATACLARAPTRPFPRMMFPPRKAIRGRTRCD
jgi:hypothetical protein